jgi:hypothetical protein
MIDKQHPEQTAAVEEHFDMPALIRLGLWGTCAVFALAGAVIAAHSDWSRPRTGHTQVSATVPADPTRMLTTTQLLARVNEIDTENRRLSDSVRLLSVDGDRLTARVAVLEHNLDGLTGSITRPSSATAPRPAAGDTASMPLPPPIANTPSVASAAQAPVPSAPAPSRPPASTPSVPLQTAAAPPPSLAPIGGQTSRSSRLAMIESYARARAEPIQAGRPLATGDAPADSVVTATDFGVDLGSAPSVNGLRTLWITLKTKHAQLLNGLWPIMSIRDRAKVGPVELRLVAGPLADARLAAQLCASFAGLGVACEPAVFDGQRLALR